MDKHKRPRNPLDKEAERKYWNEKMKLPNNIGHFLGQETAQPLTFGGTLLKRIYWRNSDSASDQTEQDASVHILLGYGQDTISNYRKLADELRRTFPQAREEEIYCGKVTQSLSVKGYLIVSWNTKLPTQHYPGWEQFTSTPEYNW